MSDNQNTNSIYVNDFNESAVKEFKQKFEELRASRFPIITIYIDSYGGEVYSLIAMLDIIKNSDVPVSTICLGKAMSCGAILLSAGTPGLRFIGEYSTVMIHDVATISFGKIEELMADVKEANRLNDFIYDILDNNCGVKSGYFKDIVFKNKHANVYLSSSEAKKHHIVDHIGLPTLDSHFTFDVLNKVKEEKPKRTRKTKPKTKKKDTKKTKPKTKKKVKK